MPFTSIHKITNVKVMLIMDGFEPGSFVAKTNHCATTPALRNVNAC